MNERLRLRNAFRSGAIDKHEYSRAMSAQNAALSEYVALLAGTDVERIELAADGVWLHSRLAPVAFACDPLDRGTPPWVSLHFGQYERAEFDMWRRLIPMGASIADVGANIGWYCAHLAALDPHAKIVAFEPVPTSFSWLSKTIARNRIANVVLERLALSDGASTLELHVDPTIGGAASAHPTVYSSSSSGVVVQATTLDDYASRNRMSFDAIKLDVEGGEFAVLRGAKQLLTDQQPMLFTEMLRRHARAFGYHPNDMIAYMTQLNYTCFSLLRGRLHSFATMTEETVETNFFFLHREKHRHAIRDLSNYEDPS